MHVKMSIGHKHINSSRAGGALTQLAAVTPPISFVDWWSASRKKSIRTGGRKRKGQAARKVVDCKLADIQGQPSGMGQACRVRPGRWAEVFSLPQARQQAAAGTAINARGSSRIGGRGRWNGAWPADPDANHNVSSKLDRGWSYRRPARAGSRKANFWPVATR